MQEYTYSLFPKIQTKPRHRKRNQYLVTILIVVLFIVLIYPFFSAGIKKTNQAESEKINKKVKQSDFQDELLRKISELLNTAQGSYSVYIYDINSDYGFGINEQTVLTAASLNKIPILAVLYYKAGLKETDLEKVITIQPDDIQNYGTGSIRYDPPGKTYSLKTLARLMMEKSDNTAAYVLGTHIVGTSNIQDLLDSWGLIQTDMEDNKTSAKDMQILMLKIYKGQITSKPLQAEMLDFLNGSDFEDRIPLGVGNDIKVYHKTGDEIGKVHDVGIIDLPGKPYYLGVLTSDISDEVTAKKNIAKISSLVYEYMK